MTEMEKLRALPVAEKLQLVEDLWDSIAEDPEAVRLRASHIAELDKRLDRLEESPTEGLRWDTLKASTGHITIRREDVREAGSDTTAGSTDEEGCL